MNSKLLLADKKPISQLLVLLAFVFLSVSVFAILSLLASMFIFKIDILSPASLTDYSNPDVISALKFMQFWQALGLFVIPPIAWSFLVSNEKMELLGLKKRPPVFFLLLIIALLVSSQPLINFFAELNQQIQLPEALSSIENWMKASEKQAEQITQAFLVMNNGFDLFINLIIIAILPALGEELLFRGSLQPLLIRTFKNPHVGIWAGAILFSAMHMQFYGFIPRMLMGAGFGYVFFWTGNLWLPIIGHFVNNGLAVVVSYLVSKRMVDPSIETIGESNVYAVVFSTIIVSVSLFLFYRNKKNIVLQN